MSRGQRSVACVAVVVAVMLAGGSVKPAPSQAQSGPSSTSSRPISAISGDSASRPPNCVSATLSMSSTDTKLDSLRVNDDIVTTGGLHGKIVRLADKILVVEIAPKIQVKIERPAVTDVLRGGKSDKSSEEKSA